MDMESFLYGAATACIIIVCVVVIIDSMIRAAWHWGELADESELLEKDEDDGRQNHR
jgi:hypothetical protein